MADVFISFQLASRAHACALSQRLEFYGLSVLDQEIGQEIAAAAIARAHARADIVVGFWSSTQAQIARAHWPVLSAKRLVIVCDNGRVELIGPAPAERQCLELGPDDDAGLALLAGDIAVMTQTECVEALMADDDGEDGLPAVLDTKLCDDWNLSLWLGLASSAPPHASANDDCRRDVIEALAPGADRDEDAASPRPPPQQQHASPRLAPQQHQSSRFAPARAYSARWAPKLDYPCSSGARYVVKTRADGPELRRAAMAIEQSAWASLDFFNFTRAHFTAYRQILDDYADWQLCLVDQATGYPVAVGNCVPLRCDFNDLPEEGWDWMVEAAASARPSAFNALGALAVSVPGVHRGKGLARRVIAEMRALAERRGLKAVVAPVRPAQKRQHPFVAIEDYMRWSDERGRRYDRSLRAHDEAGGRLIKSADRSLIIEEPTAFWEVWTGRTFERSDCYLIEGAIAPVCIDVEQGVGRYVEPSVWFAYSAGQGR